jgi:vitamin B12 transporter
MKPSIAVVALTSSLSLYSSLTFAQASSSTDSDTMVVTANRFDQKSASVLASTTVITHQQITTLQVNSALDVLKSLAGIEVVSYGGKAQDTSIFMRGTSAKHTLILLDGVRINSLTSGGSSIGLIPAFAIERIEVIRGPRAAAYGSDALGGVISITTNADYQSHHQAHVGYGSHNHSLLGWQSTGALNDTTQGEFLVAQEKSDGYRVVDSAPAGDTHGYKAQTYLGHLRHRFNDQFLLQLSGYKQDSDYEYDSYGTKYRSNGNQQVLAGILKYHQANVSSELQLSSYYNESKFGQADDSDSKDILAQRKNTISWLNGLVLQDISHLQFGLEYSQDKAERLGAYSSNYGQTKKHTQSVFMTSSSDIDNITFELSGRYDDSSSFGRHSTWNTGIGYWLTDNIQMLASVGTGYKEPTFNDLYWPSSAYTVGNPDVKPESSLSREIGLRGQLSHLVQWNLSVYRNDIKDMIAWAERDDGKYAPSNVDRARIEGIELGVNFSTGPIQHQLQADWKDPTDATGIKIMHNNNSSRNAASCLMAAVNP